MKRRRAPQNGTSDSSVATTWTSDSNEVGVWPTFNSPDTFDDSWGLGLRLALTPIMDIVSAEAEVVFLPTDTIAH